MSCGAWSLPLCMDCSRRVLAMAAAGLSPLYRSNRQYKLRRGLDPVALSSLVPKHEILLVALLVQHGHLFSRASVKQPSIAGILAFGTHWPSRWSNTGRCWLVVQLGSSRPTRPCKAVGLPENRQKRSLRRRIGIARDLRVRTSFPRWHLFAARHAAGWSNRGSIVGRGDPPRQSRPRARPLSLPRRMAADSASSPVWCS